MKSLSLSSNSISSSSPLLIDVPCFGCPYDENSECIDLKYSIRCLYLEKWVLGLHTSTNDRYKKVKVVTIKKQSLGRYELHGRHGKNERQGW